MLWILSFGFTAAAFSMGPLRGATRHLLERNASAKKQSCFKASTQLPGTGFPESEQRQPKPSVMLRFVCQMAVKQGLWTHAPRFAGGFPLSLRSLGAGERG